MTLLLGKELEVLVLLMVNLLALDQASTTTGYSIFKDGKPIVISHFTAKGTDLGSRLEQLRNKIIELINEYEIDEETAKKYGDRIVYLLIYLL